MPRGKYVNHKGRSRHFTNPEELEQQRREEAQKAWRKKKDNIGSDEEEEDEDEKDKEEAGASGSKQKDGDSESSSGSEDESDEGKKKKGVEGLIEIENPNRIVKKEKKVTKVSTEEGGGEQKPELSRREREELEKQRARAHYQKLHAEGKTDEARADLARLALIRKQREEAAKKREEDKLAKEAVKSAKQEATGKALGKEKKSS